MPNKHAAIKDLRKNARHAARNTRLKTHTKHLLQAATALVKAGSTPTAKAAVVAFQKIADKAVKNNVMTRAAANRKKASLMKAVASVK